VDFLNPVEVGELLTLKARVNYVGRTSMTVGIRVTSENIHTGEIKHCNSSYFLMVAKNEDGSNAEVPKLKLTSKEGVRRFIRSLDRLNSKKKRKQNFHKDEFSYEEYKEEIKKHNVLIELEDK
jgi:acyl-CoA hydrolase